MTPDTHSRMLRQATHLGRIFSKDPSTQVGFLAFDNKSHSIIARGYNGMPRNFPDTDPSLHIRPLKYDYFEHAERNGLYNEAQPFLANSLAISTHIPSVSDARALISVQIAALVILNPTPEHPCDHIALDILHRNNTPTFSLVNTPHNPSLSPLTPLSSPSPLLKPNKIAQNAAFLSCLTAEFSSPLPNQHPCGTLFLNTSTWSEITQGYGGFIDKTNPNPLWTEDPARNAIFNLLRKHQLFHSATAAVSATSCVDCARALIQAGFSRLLCVQPSPELEQRWHHSFNQTRQLCALLDINLQEIPATLINP